VGPFGGDDADFQRLGQTADGWQRLPFHKLALQNVGLDLIYDLQIERIVGGVGQDDLHGGASLVSYVITVNIQYIRYGWLVKLGMDAKHPTGTCNGYPAGVGKSSAVNVNRSVQIRFEKVENGFRSVVRGKQRCGGDFPSAIRRLGERHFGGVYGV